MNKKYLKMFVFVLLLITLSVLLIRSKDVINQKIIFRASDDYLISKNFYYIQLTRKPNSPQPQSSYLGLHLAQLFKLPEKIHSDYELLNYAYGGLYYDTREGDPYSKDKFDSFNYYLLLFSSKDELNKYNSSKEYLSTNQTYEDQSIKVTVKKADPRILPYLIDSKRQITQSGYCQDNSDCILRYASCGFGYGAYNYYQLYLENIDCKNTEPQPKLQFKGVECRNNFCSVIN